MAKGDPKNIKNQKRREWRLRNIDICRAKGREQVKRWGERNPEKIKKIRANSYARDRERLKNKAILRYWRKRLITFLRQLAQHGKIIKTKPGPKSGRPKKIVDKKIKVTIERRRYWRRRLINCLVEIAITGKTTIKKRGRPRNQ